MPQWPCFRNLIRNPISAHRIAVLQAAGLRYDLTQGHWAMPGAPARHPKPGNRTSQLHDAISELTLQIADSARSAHMLTVPVSVFRSSRSVWLVFQFKPSRKASMSGRPRLAAQAGPSGPGRSWSWPPRRRPRCGPGWVGIAQKTGFGLVSPLAGIWPSLHLDTTITLPVRIELVAPGHVPAGWEHWRHRARQCPAATRTGTVVSAVSGHCRRQRLRRLHRRQPRRADHSGVPASPLLRLGPHGRVL